MDFIIRAATFEDCKDIWRMMSELTEHEGIKDQVEITQEDLERDGFCKNPFFHGIIAEIPEQHRTKDGHHKVGYALYYFSYSSWKGRSVSMEDLYVTPQFRGKGLGKALMSKVAELGLAAGCTQMNFTVSDQNKIALEFYKKMSCFNLTLELGYYYMCCKGDAFHQLAKSHP